jgi:hypothetical protein
MVQSLHGRGELTNQFSRRRRGMSGDFAEKHLVRIAFLSKCGGDDRLRSGTDEIFLQDDALVRLPFAFDPVLKGIAERRQSRFHQAGTGGFRGRAPMGPHRDRFSNHIKMLGHHPFAAWNARSVNLSLFRRSPIDAEAPRRIFGDAE